MFVTTDFARNLTCVCVCVCVCVRARAYALQLSIQSSVEPFFLKICYLIYVHKCFAWMHVHHMCAWCTERLKEGTLGTSVKDGLELADRC